MKKLITVLLGLALVSLLAAPTPASEASVIPNVSGPMPGPAGSSPASSNPDPLQTCGQMCILMSGVFPANDDLWKCGQVCTLMSQVPEEDQLLTCGQTCIMMSYLPGENQFWRSCGEICIAMSQVPEEEQLRTCGELCLLEDDPMFQACGQMCLSDVSVGRVW